MNQAIETMMSEHRLIEQVLLSLATFADELEAGRALPRESVAAFAAFFKEFADKCHHGKEEDRLFVQMNQIGFPREQGPIAVMLAEHDEGREEVGALAEIGRGNGPLSEMEKQSAIFHARNFIPLLLAHIQKEDKVLYPMAMHYVPATVMTDLDSACRAYDAEVMGAGEIQHLQKLAQELLAQYPPKAGLLEQFQSASAFGGCH
jgi:hemerythrin-like domain-containing protein